jgi:iron-sulfur cluster repair protein YtfE (RIC family)
MTTDTSAQTVTAYLMADHRRLDGLMETCKGQAEKGDMKGAGATFAEFRAGLMRHIKIEERLLFPEFEAATGLDRGGGPTGVMRLEHTEIIRLLDLIEGLFEGQAPSAPEFDSLRSALIGLLHEHNGKEERILYPMTDRMVAPDALHDLLTKMKAFE